MSTRSSGGKRPPPKVGSADAPVRIRLGELIDGRDRWWARDHAEVSRKVVELIGQYALPFFDRTHSLLALEGALEKFRLQRRPYPPDIGNLAVIMHMLDKADEACPLLDNLGAGTAWAGHVEALTRRLGCASTT